MKLEQNGDEFASGVEAVEMYGGRIVCGVSQAQEAGWEEVF